MGCSQPKHILLAQTCNRTFEQSRRADSLAHLAGSSCREPLIRFFTHKLKNVVDSFVGNNVQKRRLLELYGQALSQGLIENWVSGGIGKLCDNDCVFLGQTRGTAKDKVDRHKRN